jgi:ubiquinone/menaquinone biosynthesis C-methylase UbiE
MRRSRFTLLVAVGLFLLAPAAAHDFDEESRQIAELMHLRPGMQVADVGAGDGRFGEELARGVGESGHAYLTEISNGELRKLRKLLKKSELTNMSVVEGESADSGLSETCCDAILLRYVVHHMSDPLAMHSSLRRSLRPDGLVVIIEKVEPDDGISPDDLVDDMHTAGFSVVSRHPDWGDHDGHYAIVFRIAQ